MTFRPELVSSVERASRMMNDDDQSAVKGKNLLLLARDSNSKSRA